MNREYYSVTDLTPRDPKVWTKTAKEKKLLNRLRRIHKEKFIGRSAKPQKTFPLFDKLIVLIMPDKKNSLRKNRDNKPDGRFIKTTFSFSCWQSDIIHILSKFVNPKNGKSTVIKYRWNGIWYKHGDLPFGV